MNGLTVYEIEQAQHRNAERPVLRNHRTSVFQVTDEMRVRWFQEASGVLEPGTHAGGPQR
jgi:hypothetical protein